MRVRAILPAPTPLRITLTLHGALVETEEARDGETALWEAVKMLIKAQTLRAGTDYGSGRQKDRSTAELDRATRHSGAITVEAANGSWPYHAG